MSSMDAAIRGFLWIAVGLLLLAANVWFVRSLYALVAPREFVIVPFRVMGADKLGPDASGVLATLLKSRIDEVQDRLNRGLAPPGDGPMTAGPAVTTLFLARPVELPTGLFEPLNVEIGVAGVQVGGILSWLQTRLVPERQLAFTLGISGDRAIVSGDLGALAGREPGRLWLETTAETNAIVDDLAYAVLHRRLAGGEGPRLAELDLDDFRTLVEVLAAVEELNRRVVRGHVLDQEFATLLERVEPLTAQVPSWHELTWLAASIAESAGNTVAASRHYARLEFVRGNHPQDLPKAVAAALEKRAPVVAGEPTLVASERAFRETMASFAELMRLEGAPPKIVFERQDTGVFALWDDKRGVYVVNPEHVAAPGLPQYVALMGRFMERNFARCFGGDTTRPFQFWDDFRYGVAAYLIGSVPQFEAVVEKTLQIGLQSPVYRLLTEIEARAGVQPVQRLGLELLERYDCDWAYPGFRATIAGINAERGLVQPALLEKALAEVDLPEA
jgi:hypothetical protein